MVSARAGEAWAREALFRRYATLANRLAFRLLGRDQEVRDVVQDAYVIVLDRLDRLTDPQAFASFLCSVIVNRVRRLLRRRRLASALGLLPGAEPVDLGAVVAPTAPPDARAELRAIYTLVQRLPVEERLALVLRRVEGLPLEQVATLSGCSLATAKRRVAAAERRLDAEHAIAVSPETPATAEGRAR